MSNRFLSNRRWLAAGSLSTAFAVTGFLGLRAADAIRDNPTPTLKTALRSPEAARRGYSGIVKKVAPAVVNISSSRVIKTQMPQQNMRRRRGGNGNGDDNSGDMPDLFQQFFGNGGGGNMPNMAPQDRREHALGSGGIISPEGYILTNNHVIDKATEVTVTLADKREFKARVVGTDSHTDIAVLKIDGSNFPSITLGDSTKVEVGDIVLAIGDPFGVGQTVTNGIVSATGRGGLGIEEVEDFIQTDAPINPGNSGGALVDDEGHLIGINTAIIAGNSGGNQGIGFAVPINMARNDMDQIVAHGKVEHGYIGILPQDVTPALAKAFDAKDTSGALVGQVTENSPAARANLRQGDIIVAVNGQPITDASQLRTKIGMMDPNQTVTLKVLRNGGTEDVKITLGEYPTKQERASVEKSNSDSSLQGVNVESLTPETAQELKLPATTKGVVVSEVDPSSHAADVGLRPGDVIQQVNHQTVTNMREYTQAVSASK